MIPPSADALADSDAALLSALASAAPALPGFAAPPADASQRPGLDGRFLERCRLAVGRLLGTGSASGTIAVWSGKRGQGRSSVAAGVALALARDQQKRVLLIDLDFDQPSQAGNFGVRNGPGLADWLECRDRLRLAAGEVGRLPWILTAGRHHWPTGRLYSTLGESTLFTALRRQFRWVVVDLAPFEAHPAALLLASAFDFHLLLAPYLGTTPAEVERAAKVIGSEKPIGVFMTHDRSRVPGWIRHLL